MRQPPAVIDLGAASVETKGGIGKTEPVGPGGPPLPGISED